MGIADEYNVLMAAEAQSKYCTKNKIPLFSPLRGRCWNCHRNIYSKANRFMYRGTEKINFTSGYSVEVAGKTHITECSHCGYSFFN